MKKIFKKLKLRDLILLIAGLIIGGSIGITATTYVLKSSEIQYTNDKSVQQAIDELYILANNVGGSNETLPVGDVVAEGYTITVPYTGSYLTVGCVYGTTENYGSTGTISNNTCIFNGTSSNQQLYYRISALAVNGKIYEYSGNTKTSASGVTIVKTGLPAGVKAIVYLDPTNLGTNCNEQNSGYGKIGCMKWYAFKETTSSYTMILDHTTGSAAWNSSGNNAGGMKEVQTELNNLVSITGWKVTPRLITYDEVVNVTGSAYWGTSYPWITSTYWTSTSGSTSYKAWLVHYSGSLVEHFYEDEDVTEYYYVDDSLGVRPVITISKSSL